MISGMRKEDKEKEKSFCFVLKNKIREPTRFEERYSNHNGAVGVFTPEACWDPEQTKEMNKQSTQRPSDDSR